MNTNQLMTVGAIGFAGFALWYITRKPGGALPLQPAQQQRDAALVDWFDVLHEQEISITNPAFGLSQEHLAGFLRI